MWGAASHGRGLRLDRLDREIQRRSSIQVSVSWLAKMRTSSLRLLLPLMVSDPAAQLSLL